MITISNNNIESIYQELIKVILEKGILTDPRGKKTLEVFPVNICLTNVRNRIIFNKSRNWNINLAIGEFAWHTSGSNELNFLSYYGKQWGNFSDDGKVIDGSCYGHKTFKKKQNESSQWLKLIDLLRNDINSRRAVLSFYDSENSLDSNSKDIPCTNTIQFLIRNKKLDAITSMRSNDVIWGFPYDIFYFTMLQEMLALELKVRLGNYYHFVGSMHLYERHFSLANEIIKEGISNRRKSMPKMSNLSQHKIFLNIESKIRNNEIEIEELLKVEIDRYWKELLLILMNFRYKKNKAENSLLKISCEKLRLTV